PLDFDTALTGQIVHATLCDFYRSARDAGGALLQGPAAFGGPRQWIEAARGPLREACLRQLERLAPATPDAFYAEIGQRLLRGLDGPADSPGLLAAFLEVEADAL